MSLTSFLFLFFFLPVTLVLHRFAEDSFKEPLLLAASIVFYALGSPEYVLLLIAAVFATVTIGRSMAQTSGLTARRLLLAAGTVLNLGILGYYKYAGFLMEILGISPAAAETVSAGTAAALPLGISFYTFKAISYLADIYSGTIDGSAGPFWKDALYLTFFAQIQSGPLSRYADLQPAQPDERSSLFAEGAFRFLAGFNKKVLLANILANITQETFAADPAQCAQSFLWLGSVCYSLQLFFDFAGYSDMAIGLSKMFGYRCPENFLYPYMTESVTRFWRRWHASLGAWFRDYVYIPLGGSRTAHPWQVYRNLFAVWLLTGLWHGASWNFIAWGLGYFAVISLERATGLPGKLKSRAARLLYRIPALLFIDLQWVLFRASDLEHGIAYIRGMFTAGEHALSASRAMFLLSDYRVFIGAAVLLCFPAVPFLDRLSARNRLLHEVYEAAVAVITAALFIWALSYVVSGQNNPFAYANF